jgi:spectinomycin phosphotransferase
MVLRFAEDFAVNRIRRSRQMEIDKRIEAILEKYYDIAATRIEQRPGGWSALAYFIQDVNKKYFLKVYNKRRPSAAQWIRAIDRYIPLLQWLHDNTILNNNIVNPIFTKSNAYKCEDEEYVYLLSEYIEGATIGENQLSQNQVNELAKILGILHKSTPGIPYALKEQQTKESFEIGFCDSLSSFIYNDLHAKDDVLLKTLKPYTSCLLDKIGRMRGLSNSLKCKPKQFVLCHADAHNWNIIQGQNMVLIDWECLKLAPQEQDLILNLTEPYAAQFLNEYKRYINYNEPDLDTFEFYFLKRKLEDIWEWIKDLRIEGLVKSEDVTLKLLKLTLEDCTRTDSFKSNLMKVLY